MFDNADDPNLSLDDYLPRSDRGDIVITSRNSGSRSYQTIGFHQLGAMLLEDSQALLLRTIHGNSDFCEGDRNVSQQVVQTLDYPALAVTQAGAYMRETSCTLQNQLELYQQQRKEVFEYHPRHSDTDYQHTVFTTWQTSLKQIESQQDSVSTFAIEMLKLVCFYHHDQIPSAIFDRAWTNNKQVTPIWPDTL